MRGGEYKLVSVLCLSSPETFVTHEKSSRSLDDLFALGERDVEESGRVGEDSVDVLEFFFAC